MCPKRAGPGICTVGDTALSNRLDVAEADVIEPSSRYSFSLFQHKLAAMKCMVGYEFDTYQSQRDGGKRFMFAKTEL